MDVPLAKAPRQACVRVPRMRITCLFFAAARELCACREAELDVPDACTAGAALDLVLLRFPALAPLRPSLQLAVNQKYSPLDAALREGDVVALIPPISGG